MQIKTSKDIGALVGDQRSQLGLTQEQLAKRVGVSRPWIVQLEKGKPTAQMSLVLRTLKELGLTLDVMLLSGKETPAIELNRIIQNTLSKKP